MSLDAHAAPISPIGEALGQLIIGNPYAPLRSGLAEQDYPELMDAAHELPDGRLPHEVRNDA